MRAIGAANGRNPVSIVLPCHRVIGSNGSLVGFGGGLEVKAALLELERRSLRLTRQKRWMGRPDATGPGERSLLPSPRPVALGGEIAVP